MCNMMAGQVIATGAFEVYADDTLIFSKLNTGRMPAIEEIVALINAHP